MGMGMGIIMLISHTPVQMHACAGIQMDGYGSRYTMIGVCIRTYTYSVRASNNVTAGAIASLIDPCFDSCCLMLIYTIPPSDGIRTRDRYIDCNGTKGI
jgi:hypothetical protein